MKITEIETFTVGAGWKNWLFVKVHTDKGIHGIGEGTLNGFIKTTEAGVVELKHLAIGQDPRRINALAKRMLDSVSLDGGHIHRTVIAAVEVACWDILGKSLGVPIHQLLGGRVRDSVLGYANGWYRTERTPETFLDAAKACWRRASRRSSSTRSAPRKASYRARSSTSPTTSAGCCATSCLRTRGS